MLTLYFPLHRCCQTCWAFPSFSVLPSGFQPAQYFAFIPPATSKRLGWSPSGPGDLSTSSSNYFLSITSSVTVDSQSSSLLYFLICGYSWDSTCILDTIGSSLVKSDAKYLLNTLAISLLSIINSPDSLSTGPTFTLLTLFWFKYPQKL